MGKLFHWPESNGDRIYYFDNLKGVLIFLVILGHLFETYYDVSPEAKAGFVFIYLFHMPVFIFVSGLFSKSLIDSDNRLKVERLINLMILCVLLLLIGRTINAVFLDMPFNINFLEINSAAWFLFALTAWGAITYVIKDINPRVVMLVAIAISLYVGYLSNNTDFLVYSRIIVFFPFYLLGYYLDPMTLKRYIRIEFLIPSALILASILILFYYYQDLALIRPSLTGRNNYEMSLGPYQSFGPLVRLLYYPLVIAISLMFMNLIPRGKTIISGFGERTLQIFFLQALFMPVFQNTGLSVWIRESGEYYPYLLVLLAVVLYVIFGLRIWKGFFDGILKYKWNSIKKVQQQQ